MKLLSLLSSLGFLALSSIASGQATRTWVSGVGDDANPCSRTAPGKTFAGAISKTAARGVISVLDPGGYGTVTITKSITLDGGGIEASIINSSVHGIIVNAAATDTVILRNITIDGGGTGLSGIRILNAAAVYIENCRIRNTTTGIDDASNTATGTQIFVKDTLIEECSGNGITMLPGASGASALVLSNSQILSCNRGLVVNPRAKAILDGSTIAFNVLDGIQRVAPGVIQSYKNNKIIGNTPDGPAAAVLKTK